MPRRQYGSDDDINLLRLALMEQDKQDPNSNAFSPGRAPSGLAMNAYLGSIPNTYEQQREGDVIGEMDRRYFQSREDDRKRQGVVEDRKRDATLRAFETRTGRGKFTPVGTENDGVFTPNAAPKEKPLPFLAENFMPVASHEQPQAVRQIRLGSSTSAEPEPPASSSYRSARQSNTAFTDPDMAMSARERAGLDPRVLAEQASHAPVGGNAALARMVQANPEILKSLSPTARTAILQEIAGAGGDIDIADPRKAARDATTQALEGVEGLLRDPNIGAGTGAYELRSAFGGLTQGAVDFNEARNKVVAALTLPNLGQLKGPMSDKDIVFVKQLATTLANPRLSSKATRAELERARDFLREKLADGGVIGDDGGGGLNIEALRKQYGY